MINEIKKQISETGYWKNSESEHILHEIQLTKLTRLRSLYKMFSWRILATTDTFIISWFITGKFSWAVSIAGIEVFTKMFLYYLHERAWLRVKFRRPF